MNEDLINEINEFIFNSEEEIERCEFLLEDMTAKSLTSDYRFKDGKRALIKEHFHYYWLLYVTELMMLSVSVFCAFGEGATMLPLIVFLPYTGAEIALYAPYHKRIKAFKEQIKKEKEETDLNIVKLNRKIKELKKKTIDELKKYRKKLIEYRSEFNLYESENDKLKAKIDTMIERLDNELTNTLSLSLRMG